MKSQELEEIITIIQDYQQQCLLKTLDAMRTSLWAGFITTVIAYYIQLYHMHVDLIWVSIGYGMVGSMAMSIITGYKHPTEQKIPYECIDLIAAHNIQNTESLNQLKKIVTDNKELTLKDLQIFGMAEIQYRVAKEIDNNNIT